MIKISELKIEYIKTSALIPYENNPRHNDDAVGAVAESIKEFGFKVPIVIDRDNVIVTGHTRCKAAKMLGLQKVPCIRADDLNEDEIKAFRLADNKVSELATWDNTKLVLELSDIDMDMSGFGFEIPDIEPFELDDDSMDEEEPEESGLNYDLETQEKVENILNLGYGQYEGVGKYDIPQLKPVYNLPEVKEWIGFNYVMSDENPEGKAVHFFIDDYQFERVWNNPEKYMEKLKNYVCVATPDFSPYGDMPFICQLFNHYRKHWIGAYWQEHGLTVIPTIRCSTDPRSLDWYLDGEPHEGIVMMSSMWGGKYSDEAKQEYDLMKKTLNPKKVFVYGNGKGMGIEESDNVEYIKSFKFKGAEK